MQQNNDKSINIKDEVERVGNKIEAIYFNWTAGCYYVWQLAIGDLVASLSTLVLISSLIIPDAE